MKTNFWKSAAAFVVGMAAMVACKETPIEPEVVDPVFPSEVTEKNVEAGETIELQFTANLDWELSIPASEQNKYWLDDAGLPASKVSGKAGDQTVSVVFSEDVYYDTNVLCEVTLTMGGESKVIAKLTRLAINRSLEVYVAETSEWGFKKTYGTEKATALALTTFEGDVTYTLPIQVVANYDWSLALPEWCAGSIQGAETLSGKSGQVVEILLTGALAENVKNGAEGVAKFIDATDNAQAVELPLTFPAFADRIEWSEPSSMEFDHTGASAMPAIGYVLAMDGYVIKALGWNGEWHDTAFADWVTVTPGEATEGLLKQVAVTLGVTENTGKERAADLFVFPASMANVKATDICEDNTACGFKAQYEKYYVGRLTQAGVPMPYISEYNVPSMGFETYEASFTTYTENQWWASMVGGLSVANQYELNYWNQWSELTMLFDSAFSYYKMFDYDFNEVAEGADFWLSLTVFAENTKGKVVMDPDKFNNPYAEFPESFIVFYDETGKVLAGVCCKYTATTGGSSSSSLELNVLQGTAQVSTMSTESEMYQILSSNLGVSTVFEVQASSEAIFQLSQPFAMANVFTTSLNPSTAVACECFDQNYIWVGPQAAEVEVVIILKNEMWVNVAAIYYTYPSSGGNTGGGTTSESLFNVTSGTAEVMTLATAGMPSGMLNNMISKYEMAADSEWMVMSSTKETEFTTNFNIGQVIVLDLEGNMVDNSEAFSVMQSSYTSFKVTAANEANYILLFMDAMGNLPAVVYYTCYY